MTEPPCGRCGKPATGFAAINDQRYCHGDDDETPTCYEVAQWQDKWKSVGLHTSNLKKEH